MPPRERREAGGAAVGDVDRRDAPAGGDVARARRPELVATATAGPPSPSGAATRPVLWSTEHEARARRRRRAIGARGRAPPGRARTTSASARARRAAMRGGGRHSPSVNHRARAKLRCTLPRHARVPTRPPTAALRGLLDGRRASSSRGGGGAELARALRRRSARTCASLDADLLDEEAVTAAAQALPGASTSSSATPAPALREPAAATRRRSPARSRARGTRRAPSRPAKLEPAGRGLVLLIAPRPGDGADGRRGRRRAREPRAHDVRRMGAARRRASSRSARATSTPDAALADLVAYLASPAGAYFSGCVLDLGAAGLSGYSSASSYVSQRLGVRADARVDRLRARVVQRGLPGEHLRRRARACARRTPRSARRRARCRARRGARTGRS